MPGSGQDTHSETAIMPEMKERNKRPVSDVPEGANAKWLKPNTTENGGEAGQHQRSQMTREQLSNRAQQLIDQLNQKRSRDSQILVKYKEALIGKVNKVCDDTEKQLYAMYNKRNQDIQETVQRLYSVLESVEKTENELEVFKQNLSMFYRDINN